MKVLEKGKARSPLCRDYTLFLEGKSQKGSANGFEPITVPDFLFDFQKFLVDWSVRSGRSAIFADCGLGKTPMGLVWADNVRRKTNKPVLYLTPLAVAQQTVRESHKFGIEGVSYCKDGKRIDKGSIVVTNYEKLKHFDSNAFSGVVCDESSILKSFSGERRSQITSFMRHVQYRLLQTATAAPNDYIELGTSSEALGYLGHVDMLNKFFKNDLNNSSQGRFCGKVIEWRLKGHAEIPFWRWVCSWARALRKPSDYGFEDGDFILPELLENHHVIDSRFVRPGSLFATPAVGLKEQREEKRRTVGKRGEVAAGLVISTGRPAIVWCQLNEEGDLLESLIKDSVQVSGKDSDDSKESKLLDFVEGNIRVLVTKPKIGAWGLNLQHCRHMTYFPSHSFEQYYQSVRRCWRFGQTKPVKVDIVSTEGEMAIVNNMGRKSDNAGRMFSNMINEMNNAESFRSTFSVERVEVPKWLSK